MTGRTREIWRNGRPMWVRYRNGGRDKVAEEGRCRMCLRAHTVRPLTRHHVVPRSWFAAQMQHTDTEDEYFELWQLRDCDANIVPLCRPCHDLVDRAGGDMEGRRLLRKGLGSYEVWFAIRLRGRAWFDRRYPAAKTESAEEFERALDRASAELHERAAHVESAVMDERAMIHASTIEPERQS